MTIDEWLEKALAKPGADKPLLKTLATLGKAFQHERKARKELEEKCARANQDHLYRADRHAQHLSRLETRLAALERRK
jgi:hypothetical protein